MRLRRIYRRIAVATLPAGVRVDAKLQAAAIVPHGDFAWDPTLADSLGSSKAQEAAREIAQAARVVGQWLGGNIQKETGKSSRSSSRSRRRRLGKISEIDPDLIFLSTPHGMALSNDFAVYMNDMASGIAEIGADLYRLNNSSPQHHYDVELPRVALAPPLVANLLQHLQDQNMSNVTGINAPNDENLLGWGEVIPLLLIPYRSVSLHGTPRQHLIWSHPLRRHTSAASMISELLRVGHIVGQWLDALPLSVAVVISGDLSHTHEASGPYGGSPEAAALMDAALGTWASNPCCVESRRALLETAASWQSTALSCGFTGFVLLHGMLCGVDDDESVRSIPTNVQPRWNATVLANRNVTYYGMMVAQFTRME